MTRQVISLCACLSCTIPNPAFDLSTTDVLTSLGEDSGSSSSRGSTGTTEGSASTTEPSATTADPTSTGDPFDPCTDYLVIDDGARNVKNVVTGDLCDDELKAKWYRIMGDAGTRLATELPRTPRCGGQYMAWQKTPDMPMEVGKKISAVACWLDDCSLSGVISIQLCEGGFYVFFLLGINPDSAPCPRRYCTAD